MKIGLHSVGYSGTWGGQAVLSLEQFIEKASALGYEAVEFACKRPHGSPLDMDSERRKNIRHLLKEKNISITCMASYHDFAAFFEHKDMAYMEKELVYMKNVIELASDLGAPLVRTYTGFLKEGIPYRNQWDSCVAGIKESAQMAAAYNITIGVQNHSCIAVNPDSMLELIAEVNEPNVKVVLEAPYIEIFNLPIRETVHKFKGLIAHSHLTEFVRRPRFRYEPESVTFEETGVEVISVPLGQGDTNFSEFIASLLEVGFDGSLSYEMCSHMIGGGSEENLDRCAKESLRFLNKMIQS